MDIEKLTKKIWKGCYSIMEYRKDRNWELAEKLVEVLGAEAVLDEVLKKLSKDEMNEYLDDTARLWEVK